MLKGIQFVVDEQGKRKAVQIDVKMYGDLWEDFYDMIIALERESEPCETLEEVNKRLLIKMDTRSRHVLCLKNEDYPASLEVCKVYLTIPDREAEKHRLIRIIDESGEDYLYPAEYFAYLELPQRIVDRLTLDA